jgi:hypothetical protein
MPLMEFLTYQSNVVAKVVLYALLLVVELLLAGVQISQDTSELPMAAKRGTFVISLTATNLSREMTR